MRELGLADEGEIEVNVRANLAFSWRYYGCLFLLMVAPLRRRLKATVDVEGVAHLDEALRSGRGAVLASAHIGDFELMGAWLAQSFDARVVVPVAEVRPRVRQRFFDRVRRSCGLTLVRETDLELRHLVSELRTGSLVVLMLDRHPGSPGLSMDVLGKPAAVSRAGCVLAKRADVAVIPIAGELRTDGRRVLHIAEPLWPTEDVRGRPAEALMAAVWAPLEELIRARPEQWHLPADSLQLPWRLKEPQRRPAALDPVAVPANEPGVRASAA
jgi:KDO2-lipid IV(A) lauroyltransferase